MCVREAKIPKTIVHWYARGKNRRFSSECVAVRVPLELNTGRCAFAAKYCMGVIHEGVIDAPLQYQNLCPSFLVGAFDLQR